VSWKSILSSAPRRGSRAQKKRKCLFAGEIPEDIGVYITPANGKVRQAAQKRETAKCAGLTTDDVDKYLNRHAKKEQKLQKQRCVGADQPGKEKSKPHDGGQTPGGSVRQRGKYFIWACSVLEDHDTLMRRRYDLNKDWPQYAKRCLESKGTALQGIVVLKAMHSDTLTSDPHALLARIFGAFITTQ
jgi:hypothetical protein